jgi:hypothetical protein
MSKIICRLCHKEFQSLARHLGTHGHDKISYLEMFPGEIVQALSEEQKKKISDSHWSKKDPSEIEHIKKALSKNGRNTMKVLNDQGKAFRMKPGFWSQEHKDYMRDLMTGRVVDDDWKQHIKDSHWSKKDADSVVEILHKIQDNSRGNKSWFFSQKMQQNFFCASGWEKIKMQKYDVDESVNSFTNRHGIKILYQHHGKERVYIPDLLLEMKDGTRIIEEIKGYIRDHGQVIAKSEAAKRFAEQNGMEYRIAYEP